MQRTDTLTNERPLGLDLGARSESDKAGGVHSLQQVHAPCTDVKTGACKSDIGVPPTVTSKRESLKSHWSLQSRTASYPSSMPPARRVGVVNINTGVRGSIAISPTEGVRRQQWCAKFEI
eukprot:9490168-Pyramimonas_sp.AAC.1